MSGFSAAGLATTPRDRVRRRYPSAASRIDRIRAGWCVVDGTTVLGRGANASRAWEDAARRLPR